MNGILFIILFYFISIAMFINFIWGKATEKAYKFHENTYWGKLLGKKRYFLFTKILAIIGIIGITVGVIAVLLKR